MRVSAHNQIDLFENLQSEWNELLSRSTANRIFSTWEWQSTWWKVYHPGELWVIECRNEDGKLLALAPWFIENHPEYGRVVRSIGCVEVTDYLDIILDRETILEALNCLAAYLVSHRHHFEVIDLCNLPETSPVYELFPDILRRHGLQTSVKQQEVCPVIVLPDTWDKYLESLDKKQRHEIRRKIRRVEGASENVDWYFVGTDHHLETEIDRFLHLMAASQAEKARFLEDHQNVHFFKEIVPLIHQRGWLQMSFLTIGSEAVAAYLNFVYDEQVLVYNSGLKPDQYGHLSPGIVLLAYNIQLAIEKQCKLFDFLRGNETYKYRMGAQDTQVFMLRAQ